MIFFPTLADLKSPSKVCYQIYVTEQSANQIRQEATCRPIGTRCVAQRNMSERCWVPNSNSSARVSNSRDGNTKEAFISPHFYTLSTVYERSFGWPTSLEGLRSCVEAANFAGILCFQSIRNLHVWHAGSRSIFVGFCSGKKQCLSQAIYFHISNFWKIELPL